MDSRRGSNSSAGTTIRIRAIRCRPLANGPARSAARYSFPLTIWGNHRILPLDRHGKVFTTISPARYARLARPSRPAARRDARVRHRPDHPPALRRDSEGGRRVALSRALASRTGWRHQFEAGTFRKQSKGQVLPDHQARAKTAGSNRRRHGPACRPPSGVSWQDNHHAPFSSKATSPWSDAARDGSRVGLPSRDVGAPRESHPARQHRRYC